jgi:hypothetical protein
MADVDEAREWLDAFKPTGVEAGGQRSGDEIPAGSPPLDEGEFCWGLGMPGSSGDVDLRVGSGWLACLLAYSK